MGLLESEIPSSDDPYSACNRQHESLHSKAAKARKVGKWYSVTFRPELELEGRNAACFFRDPLEVDGDGGSPEDVMGKDNAWEAQRSKLDQLVNN